MTRVILIIIAIILAILYFLRRSARIKREREQKGM
jgi:uncharacterized protein YpmB